MKAKQELVSYSLNTGLLLPTSKLTYRYAKYLTSRASEELIFASCIFQKIRRERLKSYQSTLAQSLLEKYTQTL